MSRLADAAHAAAVVTVVAGLVCCLVLAASSVRPGAPDDGARREPHAEVGAKVITEHGPGVITAQIRMGDGYAWQVRLESGRYAVLYRPQMVVLREVGR